MKTTIIHRPERIDRIQNIASLMAAIPGATVFKAVVPDWVAHDGARAVRGCMLSHLDAALSNIGPDPVLVLEDDAVLDGDLSTLPDKVPDDAAAIVLGGDAEFYFESDRYGWRQVVTPMWGSQAVLYMPQFLPRFLLHAYRVAASKSTAFDLQGAINYETALITAAASAHLRVYRPGTMAFTTLEDRSDSRNVVLPPRRKAWTATDNDPLLPPETWQEVFGPWSGKTAALLQVPGNVGDDMINAATRQLFIHYDITETTPDEAEVLFYPGGGNVGGQYDFKDTDRAFEKIDGPAKVVLPQTLLKDDPYLEKATHVWVRDATSQKIHPRAQFAPDVALGWSPPAIPKPDIISGRGTFFRQDDERVASPPWNDGDPVTKVENHIAYLHMAQRSKEIHTNRLHFAIAALHAGAAVTLYPNSYHKNRSVWEASLRDLGCSWSELK